MIQEPKSIILAAVIINRRYNPGILALQLLCKGVKLDPTSDALAAARPVLRIRAGLGSGIEVKLRANVYLNVPIHEQFVAETPYLLTGKQDRYFIQEGMTYYPIELPKKPRFYEQLTSRGIPMSKIGVLQGTYLGIFPTRVCDYWCSDPRLNCRFCTTGVNVGVSEIAEKTVADVVEVALAAQREAGVTFVHFNTGYYGDQALTMLKPYIVAIKRQTRLLVGVQAPPQPDLSDYDELHTLGVDHVSFCFEFFSSEYFRKYCPGKHQTLGQQAFFRALEYCAQLWGPGRVSGEIIAGLEPMAETLRAIEYICRLRAFPTVCVFRPLKESDLQDYPSPEPETLIPAFRAMYEGCMKYRIPLGIAPNIRVSLVVQADEGRFFVPHNAAYYSYQLRNLLMKAAFRSYFFCKTRLKPYRALEA